MTLAPSFANPCSSGSAAWLDLPWSAFGIFKVYAYVDQNVAYSNDPPKVVLKDRPAWMSDLLADQICEAARPPGGHSALNRDLPKNAKMALQENVRTNAWIREIRQLKLVYGERPGDTLVLDCEFRAPSRLVAMAGEVLPRRFRGRDPPRAVQC